MTTRIPLARPDLSQLEIDEVMGVLRSPWLSMGPKLKAFEQEIARQVGVPYAVAVCNGTCGLHLALRAVRVEPDTEVITTPFSFVASANAILFERARPVFVDIDPDTLNITPETVEATIERDYAAASGRLVSRRTGSPLRAILPVAVFGHPVDIDGFRAASDHFGLALINDTCEAWGSLYSSEKTGGWVSDATAADAAVFAFYPNKQITTGEGGVVVTQDETIARYCTMARNQGRSPDAQWLEHEILGFNYRMDELSAALGLAQLRRAPELLARRDEVAQWYGQALAALEEVEVPRSAPWARVAWFVYVIRLRHGIDRDGVVRDLAARGIEAKPYFPPIHLQPVYRALGHSAGDFPVTEDIAQRTVALPFYAGLALEQVEQVVEALKEAVYTHGHE